MPKRDKPQPIALTSEEVNRLIDACKFQRDRAILLCLLDTGCRASEFLSWRAGDVNLKTGVVAITKTKNREGRVGFLGFQARKALLTYLAERNSVAPDNALWVTVKGRGETPLTYHGLKQMFRLLAQTTGIHVSAHSMRRTFVTWALRGGMNLFEVQRLAGHSDLQVLRHYAAVTENDLQEAHKRVQLADSLTVPNGKGQRRKSARGRK
jgi:integrase/recombinase XerD